MTNRMACSPIFSPWFAFVNGVLANRNFTKYGMSPRGHPQVMNLFTTHERVSLLEGLVSSL